MVAERAEPRALIGMPSMELVLDAAAILQDLRWSARNTGTSLLNQLANVNAAVVPSDVLPQVDRNIDQVARSPEIGAAMREAWEGSLRPSLTVVDCTLAEVDCPALAERDASDLPLLNVQAERGRAVILTIDRDLIDLGLAPSSWLNAARSARHVVLTDAVVELALAGAILGARSASAVIGRSAAGSVAAHLTIAVVAVAIAAWLMDPSRREQAARRLSEGLKRSAIALAQRQDDFGELQPFLSRG